MRTVHVHGASLLGIGAERVIVEAQFEAKERHGRLEVLLSGLPDAVIRESRGRLSCALREGGLALPPGRLYLNLVPAARPKSGEILDLPLVLAAASALGHLPPRALEGTLFLGEVGIDGGLHAVPGGLAAALAARDAGLSALLGPQATAREAAHLPDLAAYGAENLAAVIGHLMDDAARLPVMTPPPEPACDSRGPLLDQVRGHAAAKRALAIAAAGGHGLLFIGPPGAGKSMLARGLVDLLPPLDLEERLEITSVLSAGGRWPKTLARRRPFRAPHHSASHAGLVGGGNQLVAGEITLAHRGVLFLDELGEFRREVLEALRTPLERGRVLLSRAGRQVELPARFQLVAAMNPCPCGYRGHPRVPCPCPPGAVRRYRGRISGPLLDRIELRVELAPPELGDLTAESASGPRAGELAAQVQAARQGQAARGQTVANARLSPTELDRWAPLTGSGRDLVAQALERRALSARAVQALRGVARTIADLDSADRDPAAPPRPSDLAQALALRAELTV